VRQVCGVVDINHTRGSSGDQGPLGVVPLLEVLTTRAEEVEEELGQEAKAEIEYEDHETEVNRHTTIGKVIDELHYPLEVEQNLLREHRDGRREGVSAGETTKASRSRVWIDFRTGHGS